MKSAATSSSSAPPRAATCACLPPTSPRRLPNPAQTGGRPRPAGHATGGRHPQPRAAPRQQSYPPQIRRYARLRRFRDRCRVSEFRYRRPHVRTAAAGKRGPPRSDRTGCVRRARTHTRGTTPHARCGGIAGATSGSKRTRTCSGRRLSSNGKPRTSNPIASSGINAGRNWSANWKPFY